MNRWKSIIGVLLILGVGFLSGFTVSSYLGKRASRPPRPDEFLSIVQENTIRDLSLTPEQQAKFKTMQKERQNRFEKFHTCFFWFTFW